MKPLLILFDSDPGRRDELLRAFGNESFHTLGVGPETASSIESISPSAIVLSLLSGAELLELAVSWKSDPVFARIPIAAVVPADDAPAAEAAWAAGVDEVLAGGPAVADAGQLEQLVQFHVLALQGEIDGVGHCSPRLRRGSGSVCAPLRRAGQGMNRGAAAGVS